MVFASAGAEFGSSRGPGVQLSAQHPGQPHPVKDSTHSTNSGAPPPTEKLANPDSLSSPTHPPATLSLNKLARLKRRSFKMTATVQSELYRLVTFILNPHLWENGFFPLVETS